MSLPTYYKRISIIIPCYNVMATIDRCLKSIFNQEFEYETLEIILIDDGSKDYTWECLKKWEQKYPYIIRAIKITHGMQGRARNLGITLARGNYLMFLDADDYWVDDKHALQNIWNIVEANPQVDIIRFLYEGDVYNADSLSDKLPDQLIELDTPQSIDNLFSHYSLRRGCWDKMYNAAMVRDWKLEFAEHLIDEESAFTVPAYFHAHNIYLTNQVLYYYTNNPNGTCGKMCNPSDFAKFHRTDNKVVWYELYLTRFKSFLDSDYELIEWLFIMNYYFTTQKLNKMRGMPCEKGELELMAAVVLNLFPHCMSHERFKNIEDSYEYPNASLLRKDD